MFSFFKRDPIKKLSKEYHLQLELAMNAQRNGDIRGYAELTEQAESIRLKMEALKEQSET